MQPKLCVKCNKNVAVVFITRLENGVSRNEGYCLKCARKLGIPQIDDAVKQMGISEEDLDLISDEMSAVFGQDQPEETALGQKQDGTVILRPCRLIMICQIAGESPGAHCLAHFDTRWLVRLPEFPEKAHTEAL